ncbi:CLUMA_CG012087, isoform A [Clunio marinus]|uniref:Prefoldin subunit 4 n=1 Tax=Clunio marinus TaxID=568069 RepID=A0A1J1IED9_9DIPT|nr:CLUMA_CG012087, isoform A [Clunio marinus]
MAKVEQKGKTNFQPDPDADVQITFDDQMRINQFANHVAKIEDLKEDLKFKKNELTNIEEAIEEIELVDEDQIQFLIGEVFIYNNVEKTQLLLKETKEKKEQEIKNIETKITEIQAVMTKLKAELYGKFGQKNIYLENDEE